MYYQGKVGLVEERLYTCFTQSIKALEQHYRSDRLRTCVSLKVLLVDGVVWSNLHQEIEDDGCVLFCMF